MSKLTIVRKGTVTVNTPVKGGKYENKTYPIREWSNGKLEVQYGPSYCSDRPFWREEPYLKPSDAQWE